MFNPLPSPSPSFSRRRERERNTRTMLLVALALLSYQNMQGIQGKSLRTWRVSSFPRRERGEVFVESDSRPIDADVELWNGPDNTPYKLKIYSEGGRSRPFLGVVSLPPSLLPTCSVAIKNEGEMEFPIRAGVSQEGRIAYPSKRCVDSLKRLQGGGSAMSFPFPHDVESVQVLLETEGKPLCARVEVLQGPTNVKQAVEVYTEEGYLLPLFCILRTPGRGSVLRVINTSPVEFPLYCSVVPRSGRV